MSDLVKDFKREHSEIVGLLLKAREAGTGSEQSRDLIFSAKKMLLAHLNKEDRYLYPILREAAEKDEDLKSTLTDYALNMDEISTDVMEFFTRYESADNTADNFETDCNNIIKALCKRISKEESVLYEYYNQVVK